MNIATTMPCLKGFRFPGEVIADAMSAYRRFALSTVGVKDLLAEQGGLSVVRRSVFGLPVLACILRIVSGEINLIIAGYVDQIVLEVSMISKMEKVHADSNPRTPMVSLQNSKSENDKLQISRNVRSDLQPSQKGAFFGGTYQPSITMFVR